MLGLGLRVYVGLRVSGFGFRSSVFGFRDKGLGFAVQGSGLSVQGLENRRGVGEVFARMRP